MKKLFIQEENNWYIRTPNKTYRVDGVYEMLLNDNKEAAPSLLMEILENKISLGE